MSLFDELKRRNVIRVGTAYVIAAWLIIQVVETIFLNLGLSQDAFRIVVLVLAIGFVPAVIFSWIFQVTPDGLERDRGGVAAAPSSPSVVRLLDRAIIVALALGVSYFAFDKFVLAPEREAEIAEQAVANARAGFYGDRSIAVMPFDFVGGDAEQKYFAEGVSSQVRNLLTKIRELRVIAWTSIIEYAGQGLSAAEVGRALDVAHVLVGSVRRAGDEVRVSAQLVEVSTGTQLWSDTYDRKLAEVFKVQDEIAGEVVSQLRSELLRELPKSRYVDPDVLQRVEEAKYVWQTRPADYGNKMYALLRPALEIDPDNTETLNYMLGAQWLRRWSGDITEEEFERSYSDINSRIRALDPTDAGPDISDGFRQYEKGNYENTASLYEQGLSKDVSVGDNVRLAGNFARWIGRPELSVRLLEHALAVDPACFQCRSNLAVSLIYAGDYARAEEMIERFMASASGGESIYIRSLLLQGKFAEVIDFVDSRQGDDPALASGRVMATWSLGDEAHARALLDELAASDFYDQRALKLEVAMAAAWMGDRDRAFELLFELSQTVFRTMKITVYSPMWRNLHDDPRWAEWREQNGISETRLDAIEFDPRLPD